MDKRFVGLLFIVGLTVYAEGIRPPLAKMTAADAKGMLMLSAKNEAAGKAGLMIEADDAADAQQLGKSIGLGARLQGFVASTTSAKSASNTNISAKNAEINHLFGEDTSVIAGTEKSAY